MNTSITIPTPDDWHLHLRDGAMLQAVLPETTRDFKRAIIMPNLIPPVVRATDAIAYRKRIMDACLKNTDFTPLMTLYLTDNSDPADIVAAHRDGVITAVKFYPAGATTNSDSGVSDIKKVMATLERMAHHGVPLCIHGEVTNPEVDIFDREKVFIETILDPLRRDLPELKITSEHITTKDGVDYVRESNGNLGATITTHHLFINRNHILAGAIRPHYYCLPVAKRENHRQALRMAATSGDARFFLGTDSAPHLDDMKLAACGCAGCFTATHTMALLAQVFDECDALDKLGDFASRNGSAHYNLPVNDTTLTLIKQDQPMRFPSHIDSTEGQITVFDPDQAIYWRVKR